ncbi:MAG: hypothetical protein Q9187_001084 [Circinaria calcarea]
MAFHSAFAPLPQRRNIAYSPSDRIISATIEHDRIDDSKEWVLFSPTRTTARTQTTSTDQTTRTAGRSRLSDFGSLNTTAKSGQDNDGGSVAVDDDEELDSLDDDLHAFQEPSIYPGGHPDQTEGSVLPVHDGLGTFAPSNSQVQQQLWNFELYNPHRRLSARQRRASSVQKKLEAIDDEDGPQMESVRMERIEQWRMEQSEVLLEEIEKETRRRRLSRSSEKSDYKIEAVKGASSKGQDAASAIGAALTAENTEEHDSFLQRLTRQVIHDLIGIDDALLSAIFGESLIADADPSLRPSPMTAGLAVDSSLLGSTKEPGLPTGWEDRLLKRVARELGILVHQLSERPDAFSSYLNFEERMDYAGIPVTPSTSPFPRNPSFSADTQASPSIPHFAPTLGHHLASPSESEHAARWGIEDSSLGDASPTASTDVEYWERTPDLRTVFTYLQQRFAGPSTTSKPNINVATSSTPHSLHRAAIIRQHHPLISRSSAYGRQKRGRRLSQSHSHLRQYNSSGSLLTPSLGMKRVGESCASASTKRSRREASRESKNFWDLDFGGSMGSKDLGVGAWGEV